MLQVPPLGRRGLFIAETLPRNTSNLLHVRLAVLELLARLFWDPLAEVRSCTTLRHEDRTSLRAGTEMAHPPHMPFDARRYPNTVTVGWLIAERATIMALSVADDVDARNSRLCKTCWRHQDAGACPTVR